MLRSRLVKTIGAAVALASISAPALAGWKLVERHKPFTVEAITVTPTSDWNRASARPGKHAIALTHDGFDLDGLEIFSGISTGEPMYRERNAKRDPMPKFDRAMLLTDLGDFFERSFRATNRLTDFNVESVTPAEFGGHRGVAVRYRYSLVGDSLSRQGVSRLAILNGKLYAANFYAPRLHYFSARLQEVETIMDGARF
jgi:hypothetical protein